MNAHPKWVGVEEFSLLENLVARLGLDLSTDGERIRRINLLLRALIPRAWAKANRRRSNAFLEWLGDIVWSHAIVEEVIARYPNEKSIFFVEGWREALSHGERQYQVAKRIGLDRLVKIPPGYIPVQRGKKTETVNVLIGSALEAVLGAIAMWNVRQAVECARRLVAEQMSQEVMIKVRLAIKATDNIEDLRISSREQLLGFWRLATFATKKLGTATDVTLHGRFLTRRELLNTHGLAELGRSVGAATHEHTDVQSMQRLLARTGKGRKLDEHVKQELELAITRRVRAVHAREKEAYTPRAATKAAYSHLGHLLTLVEGRSLHVELLSSTRGGSTQELLVQCRVNHQEVGRGAGKTLDEAKEQAALAALTSPLFEKLLSKH